MKCDICKKEEDFLISIDGQKTNTEEKITLHLCTECSVKYAVPSILKERTETSGKESEIPNNFYCDWCNKKVAQHVVKGNSETLRLCHHCYENYTYENLMKI